MSWKRLIQMLYKSPNILLLGYKKFNVSLFTFREHPLKWKNNFKLQNVMVAVSKLCKLAPMKVLVSEFNQFQRRLF